MKYRRVVCFVYPVFIQSCHTPTLHIVFWSRSRYALYHSLCTKCIESHQAGARKCVIVCTFCDMGHVTPWIVSHQEPTDTSKQLIRTHYLGHVTGHQPIGDRIS
eukprot:sb/3478090/